ncbi:MAG: hypothetical protein EOM19_00920 [Candidatus Moranbacteria bacterium]|nr:hypothetical protein [Candidatus Moranbacteria bacterium]
MNERDSNKNDTSLLNKDLEFSQSNFIDGKIANVEKRQEDIKKVIDERLDSFNERLKKIESENTLLDNRLFQFIIAVVISVLSFFMGRIS